VLEARPRHRHAPGEVARDAAVAQVCGQPAARQRDHERRPSAARIEPGVEPIHQHRLAQKQVPAVAQRKRGVAGQRGARPDELGGIEQAAAVVALVAARAVAAAVRAGAEHVAVRQEAVVGRRPHLPHRAHLDQAGRVEPAIEVLGQGVIVRRGRAAEVVEREAEAAIDVGLDRVLRVAVRADVLPGAKRAELRRGAVLVGAADEQHVVAELAAEPRMDVGRQQRADQIAEMLDAVDVRNRAGDQDPAHGDVLRCGKRAGPEWKKKEPFRGGGRARACGALPRAYGRASALPA
jgi:hypothetical protein